MLPVVFEEFELVCIFFAFFFLFAIIVNWLKVNFSKMHRKIHVLGSLFNNEL